MQRLRRHASELAGLGILLGLWAAYYYRILFLGHTVVLLDSSRFFYPLWKWGAGVWKQGLIPLWNPDAGFGTPYLADPQMAAWYPPRFFFYSFFPPTTAFNFLILGHHFWAILGFWAFARNRGYSPWIALAGCMVFGFSFNAASLAWITPILFTYSWIPWIFLAADRLRDGKSGSFLTLLTALAMQMAAGYPLLAYLTGLALGLDWLLRVVFEKKGKGGRGLARQGGWAALALVGALAYNAAWLLPLEEMAGHSNLSRRMGLWQGTDWVSLATWFNPFFNGHPLLSHPATPLNFTVYFAGLPTLVILIWGIAGRKANKALVAFFLIPLALSMGESAFLGGWLKWILPGYSLVVRSGYWIPLVLWAGALLFMESAGKMLGDNPKSKGFSKNEGVWILSVGLVFGSALWLGVPWTLWSFWLSFLLTAFVGIPLGFSLAWRRSFLVLSLFFSLGPAARSINFTMDKAIYDTKPLLCASLAEPGRVYESPGLVDSFQTVAGKSVGDLFEKQKQGLIPNWPLAFGLEEVGFANSLFLEPFFQWYMRTDPASLKGSGKALDYLNARYALGERPALTWKEAGTGFSLKLWENPDAFPKWFPVERAVSQPPGDWAHSIALNLLIDFKKECCISDDSQKGDYSTRVVKEVSRTPSRIALDAEGPGRALLVSSETAYPGWKAEIGGEWRSLEEVNHGFRGLILENGEEAAIVAYQPATFRLGCFLSLLACGLWISLLLSLGWKWKYA